MSKTSSSRPISRTKGGAALRLLQCRYLDASCLLFDERRQLLGTVDFSSRFGSTAVGGEEAVEHSGDILQPHLLEGKHTLHVNLERLEPCVREVFVTLSAWGDLALGVSTTLLSAFNCICSAVWCAVVAYHWF